MFYRAWQFFRALFARIHPRERELVSQRLEPSLAALFWQMDRCDQRHGLDVYHTLQEAGYQDRDLLQAALLHDVGKAGGGLTLAHRVAVVLLEKYALHLLERWVESGRTWRAPFVCHAQHAQLGAEWALQAGIAPQVAEWVRRHHDPDPTDDRLAALQWADRQN